MVLLEIIWNDILPLFAFIGCGWFLDSKFKIDIGTYSKLTVYVILPGFIFFNLYKYQPSPQDLAMVPAALLLLVLMYLISMICARKFGKENAFDFCAVSTFSNSGHLGAALAMMIFSHAPFLMDGKPAYLNEAMGIMSILMVCMNIAVNTLGAAMVRHNHDNAVHMISILCKTPALYGALLAFLVRFLDLKLEGTFIYPVLYHFDGAFLVLITITVGLQLHRTHHFIPNGFILASSLLKLIVSPILAYVILLGFGTFSPVASQVFLIYAAIPSSITLVIYGIEYQKQPGLLVQSVIFNTIAGILTVPAVIYLCRILFPASV